MTPELQTKFAAAYNDIEAHPRLVDVGAALDLSHQTVRNYAAVMRRKRVDDPTVPELISRVQKPVVKEEQNKLSPAEHAQLRAGKIRQAVGELFTSTRWPVVNPEALVTEHRTARRYDRNLGDYVEIEGTPRTWLTDTLRVAGIDNVRGCTFAFTGAQNDAPLHEGFWNNLRAYVEDHLGGDIAVGPWTYETNWWDENSPTAREYDPQIVDYLCFGQMPLGNNFVFCGEMNTLPTSPRPVDDMTAYAEGRWAVFPHARLQLRSVPSTNPAEQASQIMTTGAVTRPKVIPRKAGIKSIFHHVIGATIVQFDQAGRIFCRQINASEDGSFYDLDNFVADGKVTSGHRARAITFADLHLAKLGRRNALATFGFDYRTNERAPGSLLEVLNPEHVFLEDIHDHEKGSHHREKDVSHHFEMAIRDRDSVEAEVGRAATFLELISAGERRVHVVESNHDVHLERYVREGRYRTDGGHNLLYGLKLEVAYNTWREEVAHCLDAEIRPPKFSLLEWAVRQQGGTALDKVHWIYDGSDSLVIDGVELGHHGHRGANGAHGSAGGFAKFGRKMTIGDKHSPAILDGTFISGVMELQHGYNKGPSGWCVTHTVQYPNGKRSLITLQDGHWRAQL